MSCVYFDSTSHKRANRQVKLFSTKELLHSKENHRIKKQCTEWKKAFLKYVSDKVLIYFIYIYGIPTTLRKENNIKNIKNAQRT